jgi:hypothetical protein
MKDGPNELGIVVPPAIAELNRLAGPLEISAVQGDTDELVAAVRNGSLHVALCFQDASQARHEHDGTRRTDLWEEPMLAALGPSHRLAGRRRIRLADLEGDPWLVAVRGGLIERACLAAGFKPHVAYLAQDPTAINGIVAANLSVTLTSRLLAERLRDITTPALHGTPVRRVVYAVTPQTAPHPLAEPLLDALEAQASAGRSP